MPLSTTCLPAIEDELRRAVSLAGEGSLHEMLAYHLGWIGEGSGAAAQGKRIRPLIVLLACAAAGGEWPSALPAAAAVELVHNFSLIHDDIEDNSPLRRGRPTLWKQWGVAQAINSGDTMYALAQLALLRLSETCAPATVLLATRILQETCLRLTQGQHLDIAYELRRDLTLDDYWPMIEGKTAALLAASAGLGALVAGASDARQDAFTRFGRALGLAFQAQDDWLGIWGDSALTGKSADSDLLTGKKSLPVLYGLQQNGNFAERWRMGAIQAHEVPSLAQQLELEGARHFVEQTAARWSDSSLAALDDAQPTGEAAIELRALVQKLLGRQS